MENNQKMENLLNLALEATQEEREKSLNLEVGYNPESRLWDVIVKFSGDLSQLAETEGITVVPMINEYAVVTLSKEKLSLLSSRPEIEYIEKPKRLFFSVNQGRAASCVNPVQMGVDGLYGKGVLVGLVDSGIDYRHPDFRNPDGTTRILRLWDQSVRGNPPAGYRQGAEYTQEQINEALAAPSRMEGERIVPSRDLSGHGTQVAGIAAGNGASSGGVYRGVAPESSLLVVKLASPREHSFPRTTELMQGIDYLIRQSLEMRLPLAVNLSFGNNYGSHLGDSLLETYIDDAANFGRVTVSVGTGNNAREALHTSGQVGRGETVRVELAVSGYERALNLQLWKSYVDRMDVYLVHPSGMRVGPLYERLGAQRYLLGNTELLVYYGEPSPYRLSQEIYVDFLPGETYVDEGIWSLELVGRQIVSGEFAMWLPGGNVLNQGTGFYQPNPNGTLTIPSTATRVIAVGAYDSRSLSYADFSGRGGGGDVKPDLAAPGVGVTTAKAGGGYTSATGTSFAAPFVTGSAALLMEWGIVRGNDPFLYGAKVKAYLRRGAKPLPGFEKYPNHQVGYGALCVRESLPDEKNGTERKPLLDK